MKTLLFAVGALALVAFGTAAHAQPLTGYTANAYCGGPYGMPFFPAYQAYSYPGFVYYPYPLPPAPSLGFGRGGIYGHQFVGRSETITGYTFPGRR